MAARLAPRTLARISDALILMVAAAIPVTLLTSVVGDDMLFDIIGPIEAAVFVFWSLYEIGFVARSGATPGKRLMGLKVIRVDDAGPVGWPRSGIRYVIVSGAPLLLVLPSLTTSLSLPLQFAAGEIWTVLVLVSIAIDSLNRGLHDKVAATMVVDEG